LNRLFNDSAIRSAITGHCLKEIHAPGIRLELKGIYVADGLLWFITRVSNNSVLDWTANPMRFSIRDRKVWRRRARQDFSLPVVARRESRLVRSDSAAIFCYAVVPRLPSRGQGLVLEYGERTGDRRLILKITSKQILNAKKLEQYANRNISNRTE
jgi:hypothetical protein